MSDWQGVCLPLFFGKHFICSGEHYCLDSLQALMSRYPDGFMMNGLRDDQAQLLLTAGGDLCCFGKRARLDPETLRPGKSLQALIRRGARAYDMEYMTATAVLDAYYQILDQSAQGARRRLDYLYRRHPAESDLRYLARCKDSGTPVGLVCFSTHGSEASLDLLLRSETARPGLMEFLCVEAIAQLSDCGMTSINLGEVPFLDRPRLRSNNWWSAMHARQLFSLVSSYYRVNSGWYSAQGLFAFKDKFSPDWEDVYWGFWPRFTTADFLEFCLRSQVIAASCYRGARSDSLLQPAS